MKSCIWLLLLALLPFGISAQTVVINEVMAKNDSTVTDPNGQYDDWIELYNNTGAAVDLTGWYFSDSYINPNKWQFPGGTSIASEDYLIIWADNDTFQAGLHAYFKLNGTGERLILTDNLGNVVDSISYGPQNFDTTFGRFPNGTGPFNIMNPTYNASNLPHLVFVTPCICEAPEYDVYPNPVADMLNVRFPSPYSGGFELIDATGRLLRSGELRSAGHFEIPCEGLANGIYMLLTNGLPVKKFMVSN